MVALGTGMLPSCISKAFRREDDGSDYYDTFDDRQHVAVMQGKSPDDYVLALRRFPMDGRDVKVHVPLVSINFTKTALTGQVLSATGKARGTSTVALGAITGGGQSGSESGLAEGSCPDVPFCKLPKRANPLTHDKIGTLLRITKSQETSSHWTI